MDLTRPPRYDRGFPCTNATCTAAWHHSPDCPYPMLYPMPRPPRVLTPAELRSVRHIHKLEGEGRLEPVRAPDMRWLWLVPPAVLIFFLLMLF